MSFTVVVKENRAVKWFPKKIKVKEIKMGDTSSNEYTKRLENLEANPIKKLLGPVNPYKWNIRRSCNGKVLDVGCGIGRNLRYLGRSDALGVDHNEASVEFTNKLGFKAVSSQEFERMLPSLKETFDSILISHVIEHMTPEQALKLLNDYLPALKKGGKVVVICPQQRGYRSDKTHETYFDRLMLEEFALKVCGTNLEYRSFPLPSLFGRAFIYNENILEFEVW